MQCIKTATAFCGQVSLPSPCIDWIERRGKSPIIFPAREARTLGKGGHLAGIYRDAHGYLWLGGWGVLDRFDERSGQFTHYHHKPDDPNSLLSQEILCIYEDRSGRLWVGQVGGLSRFDPATEKFINYQNNPADPASLGSNGVTPSIRTGLARCGLGPGRAH